MSGEPFSYAQLQEQLNTSNEIIVKLEEKVKELEKKTNTTCKWEWNKDSTSNLYLAFVECKGDIVLFNFRRIFSYCPYCGRKIREI